MLLAIDPGTDCGWSLFVETRLVACGLGDPRHSTAHRVKDIERVVIERPFVYPKSPVDPNDIIALALKAGEWAGHYRSWSEIVYVFPWQWKGSVPKPIHHQRIRAKLSEQELKVLRLAKRDTLHAVQKSKVHNVVDAIGLGLFGVGR